MPPSDNAQLAMIEAAIRVWGRTPSASLGQIATEAGIGRTTLHRRFPDRASLLVAVDSHIRDRFAQAAHRADLDQGAAPEALARLAVQFLDLGDPLRLVLADGAVIDPAEWSQGEASHERLVGLFRRGVRQGDFDDALDPEWMVLTLWLLLYGAWLLYDGQHVGLRDAQHLLLRTLDNALRRPTPHGPAPGI